MPTARQSPKWSLRGLRWDRTEAKDFTLRHPLVRPEIVQGRASSPRAPLGPPGAQHGNVESGRATVVTVGAAPPLWLSARSTGSRQVLTRSRVVTWDPKTPQRGTLRWQ